MYRSVPVHSPGFKDDRAEEGNVYFEVEWKTNKTPLGVLCGDRMNSM